MARRTATAQFSFAIPPEDQELIRWYFELYREGPTDVVAGLRARHAERLLSDLGAGLFGAVFDASPNTGTLWAAVRPDLAEFRVEIVTDVAGATALLWETMTDPGTGQVLALGAGAMVRAHPRAALGPQLPEVQDQVRVLLVISRPGVIDVPFRSVAHHLARLQEGTSGALKVDVLRPPTLAQLIQTLQAARERREPYQVVHFDGHGVWGDADDEEWLAKLVPGAASGSGARLAPRGRSGAHGYLLFENAQPAGNVQLVDGPTLGNLLVDAGVPVLILNACRSALADPAPESVAEVADPHAEVRAYGSLAQEVMDNGVAGVLAMRYNIYVPAAARFIADLYDRLLQGRSFGAAVRAARQSLQASPADAGGVQVQDWMVPVAYEAAPLRLTVERPSGDHTGAAPGSQAQPARGQSPDRGLPAPPLLGFYGRDDTLLALDRAFDTQPIVLLYGEPGIGKTTTAAEFGRWYTLTGGVQGPAIYTSLNDHATITELAAQLTAAMAAYLDPSRPPAWDDLAGDQALLLTLQLLRQRPVLWILDNLAHEPSSQQLLSLLRSVRDTKAKLLLISRDDQQAWLGDLPARLHLPPLPPPERNLLLRAVAASRQVQLTGLGATSPVLRAIGGNPQTLIELAEGALRAGSTTDAELESYIAEAVAAAPRKDEES